MLLFDNCNQTKTTTVTMTILCRAVSAEGWSPAQDIVRVGVRGAGQPSYELCRAVRAYFMPHIIKTTTMTMTILCRAVSAY